MVRASAPWLPLRFQAVMRSACASASVALAFALWIVTLSRPMSSNARHKRTHSSRWGRCRLRRRALPAAKPSTSS
eukprot:2500674-Pyramimonas_sp.AAC.1